MTAYCAKSDLLERFGKRELEQLTDETAATTEDDSEITKACDEATSLIDGYLVSHYATPLNPVPTIVRKWACDIARKFLWKDRAGVDSVVTADYQGALAQLLQVARGVVQIPGADGVVPPVNSSSGFAYAQPAPVFNTDGLL